VQIQLAVFGLRRDPRQAGIVEWFFWFVCLFVCFCSNALNMRNGERTNEKIITITDIVSDKK
jgi:hypothetical protein